MKKILALVVSLSCIGAAISTPANAGVRAGTTCLKLGSKSITSDKKFTCIKSGKKFVWDTGVLVSKVATKPASSASTPSTVIDSSEGSPQSTAENTNFDPNQKFYAIGQPCELSGLQGTLADITYICGHDFTKDNVWEVQCAKAGDNGWHINGISGTCTANESNVLFWVFPNISAIVAATPKQNVKTIDINSYTAENHPNPPTSFSDLYQKRTGISYAVWSTLVSSASKFNGEIPAVQIMEVNPRVTYSQLGIKNLLFLHKAMNPPSGIKAVKIYYFDTSTVSDVATKVEKEMGAEEYKKGQQNQGGPLVQCHGSSGCQYTNAWATRDGILYLFMAVPNVIEGSRILGVDEATEYFHAAWTFIYAKNNALKSGPSSAILPDNQPPYWMNIGLEQISGNISVNGDNFIRYMQASLIMPSVHQVIPDFSEAWLNNFLDLKNLGNGWSDAHAGLPTETALIIGPKIMEILISLRGTQAYFDFYQRMSQGEKFDVIFKDIYKISWQEAQPIIAKVIFEELTN